MHIHFPPLLLAGLLSSPCLAATTSYKLWGQVRHGQEGIPGALITVGTDSCRTDASGNYSFQGLPPGPCHIGLHADGYEAARDYLYLRREAFLPLNMVKPRSLVEKLDGSADPVVPGLLPGLDFTGDAWPERLGWQGLTLPSTRLIEGLPVDDAWGLSPVGLAGPHAWRQPQVLARAFFAASRPAVVWTTPPANPLPESAVTLQADTGGGRQARLALKVALGSWHQVWAEVGGSRVASLPVLEGAKLEDLDWSLHHRYLAAAHLTLRHSFQLEQTRIEGASSQLPALWLPLSSAESWQQGRLDDQRLRYQVRAEWSPSAAHRSEAMAWLASQELSGLGLELDRVLDRLPQSTQASDTRHRFSTLRQDRRQSGGLRLASVQEHERGRLSLGLELERQLRRSSAMLGEDSLVGPQDQGWFTLEEEVAHFAATLRDRWRWSDAFNLEAALDLRYYYYDLQRLPWSGAPDRAFKGDLLALNPAFSLGQDLSWTSWELQGQRRNWLADPTGWWAPGRSPEAARDEALVVTDAAGELGAYLPVPLQDELRVAARRPATSAGLTWHGALWVRSWQNLALPWWTPRHQGFLPQRPVQALDAREGGLDLGLDWRVGQWQASVQLDVRRAQLEGWLWQPLPDSSLWTRHEQSLNQLPGTPGHAWQVQLWRRHLALGPVQADLGADVAGWGVRSSAVAPGVLPEEDSDWAWSAQLELSARRPAPWRLHLWIREGQVQTQRQLTGLNWQADLDQGQGVSIPASGRKAGLTFSWSLNHGT